MGFPVVSHSDSQFWKKSGSLQSAIEITANGQERWLELWSWPPGLVLHRDPWPIQSFLAASPRVSDVLRVLQLSGRVAPAVLPLGDPSHCGAWQSPGYRDEESKGTSGPGLYPWAGSLILLLEQQEKSSRGWLPGWLSTSSSGPQRPVLLTYPGVYFRDITDGCPSFSPYSSSSFPLPPLG